MDDVQVPTVSSSKSSFGSEKLTMTHGSRLYINVKCVSNIELSTTTVSDPIVISTMGPDEVGARVGIIPSSPYSMNPY